jgi:hypothetical protein
MMLVCYVVLPERSLFVVVVVDAAAYQVYLLRMRSHESDIYVFESH